MSHRLRARLGDGNHGQDRKHGDAILPMDGICFCPCPNQARSKDVETFGSGIRIMYSLCEENNVAINYTDSDTDFVISFSRKNRNIMPNDGTINGTISDGESEIMEILRKDKSITIAELARISDRSVRTTNRIMSLLKAKGLIERIGSNKKGYWEVK